VRRAEATGREGTDGVGWGRGEGRRGAEAKGGAGWWMATWGGGLGRSVARRGQEHDLSGEEKGNSRKEGPSWFKGGRHHRSWRLPPDTWL
jgi:hypothetical protein